MILQILSFITNHGDIDHDILLKRLDSRFSINGTALDWFRSYLTNRTQFALIDGKKNTTSRVKIMSYEAVKARQSTTIPSQSGNSEAASSDN